MPSPILILVIAALAVIGVLVFLKSRAKPHPAPTGATPLSTGDYAAAAKAILEGVGGASNVAAQSHCVSRLRIELKDGSLANEKKLRASGAAGIMRPNKNTVQIVIGAKTAEVAAAFEQLL